MKKVFWLIQTGHYNPTEKDSYDYFIDNSGSILTRKDAYIRLNYMGSAEYEWGAVPKCIQRIRENSNNYEVVVTDILNTNGVPLILCCHKENTEELIQYIKEYIEQPYRLKEPCGLEHHCKNPPYDDETTKNHYTFVRTNNQFWLDIEHDWFATFGAADRIQIFESVLNLFQKQRNGDNK